MRPSSSTKTQHDHALVLKRHPYSESSVVVSVLTHQHGPVQLLARGAHRPKSRYYAVLDFFHELEIEWTPPRRGELGTLVRGELRTRRRGITRDLASYRCAMSCLELAHMGSRPGHRETALFDLLSTQLEQLDAPQSDGGVLNRHIAFELGFLQLHGLAPALNTCASCAKPAPGSGTPPRVGFSAGAGGRLCQACVAELRAGAGRVGTLPLDVIEVAAKITRCEEIVASPELLLRVRDFVERFLGYHLGTRPRSHREFLSAPNRNAPPSLAEPNP